MFFRIKTGLRNLVLTIVTIIVYVTIAMLFYQENKLPAMAKSPDVEMVLKEAKRIMESKGLVIMTLLNDAYLEFALSWLCNTRWMAGVHDHVLMVTTDPATAHTLQRFWPAVSTVDLNMPQYSGDQEYTHVGYLRLMVERTALILTLLQNDVRVLLFECDSVWLQDPLPLLLATAVPGLDILATLVDTTDDQRTAGCFLLLTPTKRTVALWRKLTSQMMQLQKTMKKMTSDTIIDWQLNDQEFLAQLVKKKFSGIDVHHLNTSLFADGNWYLSSEEKQKSVRPYIINNNFIKGNRNKKNRALEWGHWFIYIDWREQYDLDNTTCDDSVKVP